MRCSNSPGLVLALSPYSGPGRVAYARRRVEGDGRGAGVQAAEEGGDVVEAGGEEDEYALAGEAAVLEVGGDGAGPGVESGPGEPVAVAAVPVDEREGGAVGVVGGPLADEIGERACRGREKK